MRRRKRFDVEEALRSNRPEPREGLVRTIIATLATGESRRRSVRSVAIAFAVVMTAGLVAALGAFTDSGSAGRSTFGALNVLRHAVGPAPHAPVVQLDAGTPADCEYVHANAGRGNGPEGNPNSSTFINPHEVTAGGPGDFPTDDCDPGNSGEHNRGGD